MDFHERQRLNGVRSASRLPECWFNLVLWLVALAFAVFLIGLGSLVVGDRRSRAALHPGTVPRP
ncbi:hypothetical protein MPEAHAMD_4175 [Methylobacterium frigidaeris]|uniref:Uncharacterized protein n=1 Tax=Methylobacterium frigidaeris TaxID=2038277 RepID=A0AA37M6N9_9HYPH|nr:hypothetical protein MPEAHAMD_4175 [Methylobacterium frigidaeris]